MHLSSWGRLYQTETSVSFLDRQNPALAFAQQRPCLIRGQGRSYGDVNLASDAQTILTDNYRYFHAFDPVAGILECESGVLLKDIQDTFIPQGWMLPVTPGTQLISVGGAIANDIHGKNHHVRGNFGHHVVSLQLLRSDLNVIQCSRQENAALFFATLGGIGLTGLILRVKIQLLPLQSDLLDVEYLNFRGVSEFIDLAKQSEPWEYTVSWIDCLSGKNVRGIFMRANHQANSDSNTHLNHLSNKTKKIPFTPPISCINTLSLKVFNQLYYHINKTPRVIEQHLYQFQYPLDAIENWNILYGRKGFYQYQCVIPMQYAKDAIEEMLKLIYAAQQGSFLVVLKSFGNLASEGMLSFPMEGLTLALDFPNLGEKTLALFNQLDQVVAEAKGRLYLAKDARMSRDLFFATYPQAEQFKNYRDPAISSDMSKRLFG
ncbi:FAD-binding oxidoreductase [Acinetobacter sp. YH16031]|uniref:FAD-binding oxidoreductase n=1 Tax=Acinetobacter sp. YH16031 TaxID=2601180 RepID=UPI0015D2B9CE|nr:FAD-binding oxidoreductase [Acinetobacter sp. YH16031]